MPQLNRFCIPALPELVQEGMQPQGLRNESFITNEIFYIAGPLRLYVDSFTSILFDGSFNYSLTQQRELCVKSLHDNTTDITFFPADLPVNDELIDIYGVIGQSKLEFQSSYHYTDEDNKADVLDSVTSFQFSLWM